MWLARICSTSGHTIAAEVLGQPGRFKHRCKYFGDARKVCICVIFAGAGPSKFMQQIQSELYPTPCSILSGLPDGVPNPCYVHKDAKLNHAARKLFEPFLECRAALPCPRLCDVRMCWCYSLRLAGFGLAIFMGLNQERARTLEESVRRCK